MPFPTRSLRFSPSFIQRAGRPATDPTEIPTVFDYDDPKAIARAEKAHRRMTANPDKLVFAWARYTTVAGWVLAGIGATYCLLYADYGPKEHVFSPVRRSFHSWTSGFFKLSASEESLLGMMKAPPRKKELNVGEGQEDILKDAKTMQGSGEAAGRV